MLVVTFSRYKYYFAFTLSECISNNAGFGYNKQTDEWNLLTGMRPLNVDFAPSIRQAVNNWNILTSKWLRPYLQIVQQNTTQHNIQHDTT